MYTKLKIKVTKEILERSKHCGHIPEVRRGVGANCAVALAVIDIFPDAYVAGDSIHPFYYVRSDHNNIFSMSLPTIAREFIKDFDLIKPAERVKMSELEFEIEIPDTVIEQIDISSIQRLLTNHPNLQLV